MTKTNNVARLRMAKAIMAAAFAAMTKAADFIGANFSIEVQDLTAAQRSANSACPATTEAMLIWSRYNAGSPACHAAWDRLEQAQLNYWRLEAAYRAAVRDSRTGQLGLFA